MDEQKQNVDGDDHQQQQQQLQQKQNGDGDDHEQERRQLQQKQNGDGDDQEQERRQLQQKQNGDGDDHEQQQQQETQEEEEDEEDEMGDDRHSPTPPSLLLRQESHKIRRPPLPLPLFQRKQPLIIHTYAPKIIQTDPSNFMWLVQRLTGSSRTRSRCKKNKPKPPPTSSSSSSSMAAEQQSTHASAATASPHPQQPPPPPPPSSPFPSLTTVAQQRACRSWEQQPRSSSRSSEEQGGGWRSCSELKGGCGSSKQQRSCSGLDDSRPPGPSFRSSALDSSSELSDIGPSPNWIFDAVVAAFPPLAPDEIAPNHASPRGPLAALDSLYPVNLWHPHVPPLDSVAGDNGCALTDFTHLPSAAQPLSASLPFPKVNMPPNDLPFLSDNAPWHLESALFSPFKGSCSIQNQIFSGTFCHPQVSDGCFWEVVPSSNDFMYRELSQILMRDV